jgi:chorismate synthase
MMSFGQSLRVTIYGSSHGPEVGVGVDGLPRGLVLDLGRIQDQLDRRSPMGRKLATKRQEPDQMVVDSGLQDGRTTGELFRAHVANVDVQRTAYDRLRDVPRPGHADYPARVRYGPEADLSGGGIFSGRMTVGLVIAGALAAQVLALRGMDTVAFTRSIGTVEAEVPVTEPLETIRGLVRQNEVGCPDIEAAQRMEEAIAVARRDGDSVGGIIECRTTGAPVGLGEPFFDSIEGVLAHALFSIPAIKGVEFGSGFAAARMRGSEHNDPFDVQDGHVVTTTNHSGGILGGLATGMPIVCRVSVKPTSSIARGQRSVDLAHLRPTELVVTGRHDPCIVPRAVIVVESVVAFVLLDLLLRGGFAP